jgi:hypothetical protein
MKPVKPTRYTCDPRQCREVTQSLALHHPRFRLPCGVEHVARYVARVDDAGVLAVPINHCIPDAGVLVEILRCKKHKITHIRIYMSRW